MLTHTEEICNSLKTQQSAPEMEWSLCIRVSQLFWPSHQVDNTQFVPKTPQNHKQSVWQHSQRCQTDSPCLFLHHNHNHRICHPNHYRLLAGLLRRSSSFEALLARLFPPSQDPCLEAFPPKHWERSARTNHIYLSASRIVLLLRLW